MSFASAANSFISFGAKLTASEAEKFVFQENWVEVNRCPKNFFVRTNNISYERTSKKKKKLTDRPNRLSRLETSNKWEGDLSWKSLNQFHEKCILCLAVRSFIALFRRNNPTVGRHLLSILRIVCQFKSCSCFFGRLLFAKIIFELFLGCFTDTRWINDAVNERLFVSLYIKRRHRATKLPVNRFRRRGVELTLNFMCTLRATGLFFRWMG